MWISPLAWRAIDQQEAQTPAATVQICHTGRVDPFASIAAPASPDRPHRKSKSAGSSPYSVVRRVSPFVSCRRQCASHSTASALHLQAQRLPVVETRPSEAGYEIHTDLPTVQIAVKIEDMHFQQWLDAIDRWPVPTRHGIPHSGSDTAHPNGEMPVTGLTRRYRRMLAVGNQLPAQLATAADSPHHPVRPAERWLAVTSRRWQAVRIAVWTAHRPLAVPADRSTPKPCCRPRPDGQTSASPVEPNHPHRR